MKNYSHKEFGAITHQTMETDEGEYYTHTVIVALLIKGAAEWITG